MVLGISTPTPKRFGKTAFIAITTLGVVFTFWSSLGAEPSALTTQIRTDVLSALDHLRTAKSHLELDTSGFAAKDVFSNVRALQNPDGWNSLCQALGELRPDQLAAFDGEIGNPKYAPDLSCASALKKQLVDYWKQSQLRLVQHLTLPPSPLNSQRARRRQRDVASITPGYANAFFAAFTLPSTERAIRSESTSQLAGRGALPDHQIALTFNDGPSPSRTPRILAILKAAGVRATFFELGQLIRENSALTRQVARDGHAIGTQGMTRAALNHTDLARAFKDIQHGREEIETSTGKETPFVRLPYGESNDDLDHYIKSKQMTSITWNMDSRDWQLTDAVALYDQIVAELDREKGGILLLHDTAEATVIVLPYLLQELKARGYTSVVFVARP